MSLVRSTHFQSSLCALMSQSANFAHFATNQHCALTEDVILLSKPYMCRGSA